MALTSTMYSFDIELADNDRGVYEQFKLSVACHPSETREFMMTRVLAYCLEFEEGLTFSKGLADPDEPAIFTRHLDGRMKTWLEVGLPSADRLHRAAKSADRVGVYTHKSIALLRKQLSGTRIHRADEITVRAFEPDALRGVIDRIDRRTPMNVTVSDRVGYVGIANETFTLDLQVHFLG